MKKVFLALFFLSFVLSSMPVYADETMNTQAKPATTSMTGTPESGKMVKMHKKHKKNKKAMKETKMQEGSNPASTGMMSTK